MARRVLDLARETTVCGDIASHVARIVEEMRPGDEILVRTRLPVDAVKESLEMLEATGIVSIVDVAEREDGVVEVLLRVEG